MANYSNASAQQTAVGLAAANRAAASNSNASAQQIAVGQVAAANRAVAGSGALFKAPTNTIHPVPVKGPGAAPIALPSGARSIVPNPNVRVQNASQESLERAYAADKAASGNLGRSASRRTALPAIRGNQVTIAAHEDHLQHFNSERVVRALGGDAPMGFGKFGF